MCGRNLQKVVCVLSAAIGLMFLASPAAAAVISPLNGDFESPAGGTPSSTNTTDFNTLADWTPNTTLLIDGVATSAGTANSRSAVDYDSYAYSAGMQDPDWRLILWGGWPQANFGGVQQDLGTMTAGETYTFSGNLFGHNTLATKFQIAFYDVDEATVLKSITEADFPVAIKGNPGDAITATMSYTALAGETGDTLRLLLLPGFTPDVQTTAAIDLVSVTVPEPGTLAMLAAGMLGLLAYAWRKRK